MSCDHLQPPASLPIDCTCHKPAVNVANGDHVTWDTATVIIASHLTGVKIAIKCLEGMLQRPQLVVNLVYQCYCHFEHLLSEWLLIKDYL